MLMTLRHVLAQYQIGPFEIRIKSGMPSQYLVSLTDGLNLDPFAAELRSDFVAKPGIVGQRLLKLSEMLGIAIDRSITLFAERLSPEACEFVAFKTLGLGFLYVPLADPRVNEVFICSAGSPIMVEHVAGRLLANIHADGEELRGLATRLAFDNNIRLSHRSPALKTSATLLRWRCRFTLDLPPLAPDGPTGNIRKLPEDPFSLDYLIASQMISSKQAVLMAEAAKRLDNILIIGRPNSGKTTLGVALAAEVPLSVRRVTVEDVDELPGDVRTSRTLVPALEMQDPYTTKHKEIVRLLHRTPDWVFLGELQDSSHVQAFLEFLSIGLVGIETTHASSLDHLLLRWIGSFGIDPRLLAFVGWIVVMERAEDSMCGIANVLGDGMVSSCRKVTGIYRIVPPDAKQDARSAGLIEAAGVEILSWIDLQDRFAQMDDTRRAITCTEEYR